MMSLREAAGVVGADGNISVLRDFFKFLTGRAPAVNVSLRNHVAGMLGPHFRVNLVQVSPEDFTGTDIATIDATSLDLREIYGQVGVGVDVEHLFIKGEDADGFRVITKQKTANKLLKRARGPGDRNIDVFLVLVFQVDGGFAQNAFDDSPTSCEDKSKSGQRGVIVGMNFAPIGLTFGALPTNSRARTWFGMIVAHEIGHILIGADHASDASNLMAPGNVINGTGDLSDAQGEAIRARCAVVEQ